ncbi:MAG: polysaccharide deacetylase family protein [Hyphomicrobiales bacterium]|nr:polysaccharide deacetylase family protein [Hyphomicrobiales bacterium]
MPSLALAVASILLAFSSIATAACRDNPAALGTARTLTIDPAKVQRVGTMQYRQTLPLSDHEIVLTFDDGPLSPYTARVLDLLSSQCVQATFFDVGRMATTYPWLVRREYDEGHSVGTHTQNHPLRTRSDAELERDIEDGVNSLQRILGRDELAPFFRFPGLIHPAAVEDDLASQGIVVWSADIVGDDWKRISAHEIVRRTMARLQQKKRGIVLLHDIHRRTLLALPELFARLKERGYRVVHVITSALATAPQAWSSAVP